jgi:hypothetical protein
MTGLESENSPFVNSKRTLYPSLGIALDEQLG